MSSSLNKKDNPLVHDVELLLTRFTEKESPDYRVFADIWKELKFHLILWVGVDKVQRAAIVESIFEVCVNHMLREDNEFLQIGSLYVIYSLYFTQPIQPKLTVRLTLDDWNVLDTFHDHVRRSKYTHTDYILCILRANSAFSICCTPRPLCLSGTVTDNARIQRLLKLRPGSEAYLTSLCQTVQSEMSDYQEQKQNIAIYLPPHMLGQPSLPDEIKQAVDEMHERSSENSDPA